MKYADKIPQLSDKQLFNAAKNGETLGMPFEYVELCKEELFRRGYSHEEILVQMQRKTEESSRITNLRRVAWAFMLLSLLSLFLAIVRQQREETADGAWLFTIITFIIAIVSFSIVTIFSKRK